MKRLWLTLGIAVAAVVAVSVGSSSDTSAQAVAQSYSADTALQIGMIVRIDSKDSAKVAPASEDQPEKVHGIVVSPNDAPIALSNEGQAQQVYVATANKYQVLVSDQNGSINKDDYITLSALDGVGMKADSNQTVVVGRALSNFDANRATSTTKVKDSNGKEHVVHLGYVGSAVNIAHNPLQRNTTSNLPGFLQRASESIAHKPVSYTRVYLSLAILLVTAIIVGSLLYGAVRTSIISLGRNPLARSSITRNMLRIVLISFIILISGFAAIYLLLKL